MLARCADVYIVFYVYSNTCFAAILALQHIVSSKQASRDLAKSSQSFESPGLQGRAHYAKSSTSRGSGQTAEKDQGTYAEKTMSSAILNQIAKTKTQQRKSAHS